jgi:hypothetical protein
MSALIADTAPLRTWLDERRAEIEHDHQDSWTGRPDQCYCDLPRPCPDRARELAAVDGLVAVLDEREQREELLWIVEQHRHEAEIELNRTRAELRACVGRESVEIETEGA